MNHHSEFVAILTSVYRPKVYVELGLYQGETWKKVMPFCSEMYGVDIVDRNIPGNVSIETTEQFFSHFDKPIDFAFIDADHNSNSVRKDLLNCLKLLSSSGVIVLHDTDPIDNKFFDPGFCGDSYKIVDFVENEMKETLNITTFPIAEAGLSIVTKKASTRTHIRNSSK